MTTLPPTNANVSDDFFGRAAYLTVSGQVNTSPASSQSHPNLIPTSSQSHPNLIPFSSQPQLCAETYACALGDVYTFGPTFRAEPSNTGRRAPSPLPRPACLSPRDATSVARALFAPYG